MYHVSHQGQQYGPYTIDQINEYLAQGAFDANSHVWDENVNGWVEIWQLPGVILPYVHTGTPGQIAPGHPAANAPQKDDQKDISKLLKAVIIINSILCFCIWAYITLMCTFVLTKKITYVSFYVAYVIIVLCFLVNLWGALKLSRVATSKTVTPVVKADGIIGGKILMYMNIVIGVCMYTAAVEMGGANPLISFGVLSLISGLILVYPIVKLGK
jgi:hypothetical protein